MAISATETRIDLDTAMEVIAAARQKAESINVAMNMAVVDDGGNLTAFARMENAWLGSIRLAIDKAWTARAFDIPTVELGKMSQPKQPLFGIEATNDGRVIIFGGGIPLKSRYQVIGAIGVSGGTPDEDHEVAEAGANYFANIATT